MLVCVFVVHFCTRDRGCSVHPVFPAPSFLEGQFSCKTSGASRRGIVKACLGFLKIESGLADTGRWRPFTSPLGIGRLRRPFFEKNAEARLRLCRIARCDPGE